MGFLELLTVVFIVLKLTGVIDWAWWLVLLPVIIAVVLYIAIFILHLVVSCGLRKEMKKMHNDFFRHYD